MVRSDLPEGLMSVALLPPVPPLPWQASHFSAKIVAPCAAVPLPGGRFLPSGPTLMSHSARSASLTGLPSPGFSWATAAPANSASATTRTPCLAVDMLDLPFAVDRPARDDVHVPHRERGHRNIDLGLATLGEHLRAGRLYVAGLIPGAALQHDRLAVPSPRQAESRQRLGEHRGVERRLRKAPAAVRRDHDLGDAPVARISETGNFVKARSALQRQPRRGMRDEGLHLHREEELPDLRAGHPVGVLEGLVDGHDRLLDELDPVQPFDVHVALVAGHQEPHRIALRRVDALAIL